MRKSERLLRRYKKGIIAEAVLSHERPVLGGFLQKDVGMVTSRGTAWCEATRSLPVPTGTPKRKGQIPRAGFPPLFPPFSHQLLSFFSRNCSSLFIHMARKDG